LSPSSNIPFLYLFAVILGAACFAESNVIIKQFPIIHPIPTNAVAMTAGSVILFLMSLIFGETPAIPPRAATWISLAYLILFGSCVVFILNLFVLKRWTASATSYQFVLLPFVTITASALLAQERLSLVLLAEAVLVIAGVYIGAIGTAGRRKPPIPSKTQPEALSVHKN
jgi:drug/metabolite transporter (DMT)-like permease